MKRRDFLMGAAGAAQSSPRTPPNILFIMPDQWRGCDMGVAGNREVRTPNLDRLSGESVYFRNMTANTPVCTPARGILLTGRYAHRVGTPVNDIPMPNEATTIAEILGPAGYHTGFVGKWHLEGGKRRPGFIPPGPRRQGFQFWAANECSHDYFKQHYFRDAPTPISMPGYDAFTWTDLALEFLDRARERRKPFCLYLQYPSPHDPYLVPPGFEGMYAPERLTMRKNWRPRVKHSGAPADIAAYYAAITCLDAEVGRLLKRVDESGFRDNTIVLFTSDHGDMLGSQGTMRKQKPWEESVIVPGLLRWPAGVRRAFTSDAVFSHVDVVPTLFGLCGVKPPAKMDGHDYAPYLRGARVKTPQYAHLAIHTRTENDEFAPWRGLRTRRYKYARFQDKPWVLYDLDKDPYELDNLVDRASSAHLVAQFDNEIRAFMRRTGDRWDELRHRPYT
jgi:arylsulfatase A-like enzyme